MPYKSNDGHSMYRGVCQECGFERIARYTGFQRTTECTHRRLDGTYAGYIGWSNNRIKHIFNDMRKRCYDPSNKSYKWYGQKGIKICDEWINNPKKFEEWSLENGYNDSLTIDRISSDKNYSPDNCQWITLEENSRKAGEVNWICVNDITLTGRQWAEKLGLGILTIDKYLKKYNIDKVVELISKMLDDPISNHHRRSHQTWFSVYGIDI